IRHHDQAAIRRACLFGNGRWLFPNQTGDGRSGVAHSLATAHAPPASAGAHPIAFGILPPRGASNPMSTLRIVQILLGTATYCSRTQKLAQDLVPRVTEERLAAARCSVEATGAPARECRGPFVLVLAAISSSS